MPGATEENRIQSIFDNGHEKTYKYNAAGQRVIKRGPQGETVYVNQYFTIRNREVGTKHIFAGNSRTVSKLMKQDKPGANPKGATPLEKDRYFYHPDHLGSSSYVTDSNGKLYQHLQYFPFGETWVEQASNTYRTPYLFTAKELDPETGLYYYGARYYDPRTSVWQSGDPILGKYLPSGENNQNLSGMGGVFNPKNLGMYSYTHLNPVKLVDPDGRDIAIFLDREAAGGQGHSAIAIMENGGQGKVTYLSYGPASAGKPMLREFKNRGHFYKFLLESTYGDKPKKGSGFNYDEAIVLRTDKAVDLAVMAAGKQEVAKKRWSLFGNLFGNEINDSDVNCKDMCRNALGAAGILMPNRMKPNNWQHEVVNNTGRPRNRIIERELSAVLKARNVQLRKKKANP